jgi:hypothetical protein
LARRVVSVLRGYEPGKHGPLRTQCGGGGNRRQHALDPGRFPNPAFGKQPLHIHTEMNGVFDDLRHINSKR